ncbi:MAG: hypothetical protein AVDCRST_MAG18-1185, partial [uncultured Thermomicrobiales bacterium]
AEGARRCEHRPLPRRPPSRSTASLRTTDYGLRTTNCRPPTSPCGTILESPMATTTTATTTAAV